MAIQGFKCHETKELFETDRSQRFGSIRKVATRKVGMLDAAAQLKDLESPPGNLRINDQWRICFEWTDAGPTEVEITNHYE